MAVMRMALTIGCLLLARSAVATNISDLIQANENLKAGLLHQQTPTPSPSPSPSPPSPTPSPPVTAFIPAPVSVQVSATQAPSPTLPPQTNPPATSSTKPPATTATPAPVASCTGQVNGTRCTPAATANPATTAILGARCLGGTCQGTQVTFCVGSTKPTCTVGPNTGKAASFCDPLVAAEQSSAPSATTLVAEVGTPASGAGCQTTADCALGFLCDGYYAGTTAGSAGGCVAQC